MSDKLTMLIQQLQEVDKRTPKLVVTSLFSNPTLPDPSANKVLRWKNDLSGLDNVDVVGQGAITLPIGIADGGTGGTTVGTARANLLLDTQVNIVAAATLPVTQDRYFVVSGNTGITALASQPAGEVVVLRFTGTPLITHNATTLILLGAVNYQVAAGDIVILVSEGSGNWREVWRRPLTNALSDYVFAGDGTWRLPLRTGMGRLTRVSGTQIKFGPRNGTLLPVKTSGVWRLRDIGSGIVSGSPVSAVNFVNGVANQSLAANTTYLVTVFDNAGTLVFDFLTTLTHAADATTGVEIKSGDDTRSVVGMIRTNATPNFQDDDDLRGVISWFNRRSIGLAKNFTADRTTTSSSYVEVNTEIRGNFVTWAEEAVVVGLSGSATNSVAPGTGEVRTSLAFDGTTAENAMSSNGAGQLGAIGVALVKNGLAEGFHFATLIGLAIGGGTSTWKGNSVGTGAWTSLTVEIRG
jgi:hypothetical protein